MLVAIDLPGADEDQPDVTVAVHLPDLKLTPTVTFVCEGEFKMVELTSRQAHAFVAALKRILDDRSVSPIQGP